VIEYLQTNVMETRQLRYFLAVAQFGSFSLASERIGIAQPALSAQIAKLEGFVGSTLFVRHARGVRLTAAGEKLHPQAVDIWRRLLAAERDIRPAHQAGEITIGIPTLTSTLLIAPLVETVRVNAPGATLRIREAMGAALREMLASGKLDMAVVYRTPGDEFSDCEELFEEDLYVGMLGKGSAAWDAGATDIASIPLVLSTPGNSHRLLLEDFARETGTKLNIVAEVDSLIGQRDLVMKGVGATVLPLSAFDDWPQGYLRLMPFPGRNLVSHAMLVRSAELSNRAPVPILTGLIRDVVSELIGSGRWRGARIHH
jgi:LysR family transcriptional regulator, nitrogen assimilation regulatory protein